MCEYTKNCKTSSYSPHESVENTACRGHVSIPRTARATSDLAILLRGWNFASGLMAVTSCIVTSCLLTKCNSIATVPIIHATLMCGQMRIPTPLWKKKQLSTTFSVNVWCAVLDDQLIGPFILEVRLTGEAYLRFLQEELPRFWRMCLWINEVVCISNMKDLLLILHVKSEISLTIVPLGNGSDVAVPTTDQPGLQT